MKRCVSVLRVPGLVPLVAEIETTVAVEGVNRESVVSACGEDLESEEIEEEMRSLLAGFEASEG